MPAESKSGGLHLYLFMEKFTNASLIKSFLTNLLSLFGLKQDTEIFPKQTQLSKDSDTGQLRPGQFINLPYYGDERKALNVDGTTFTLDQFMKVISSNLVTKERLKEITQEIESRSMEGVDEEFTEGPPCLAAISKIAGQDNFDGKDRFCLLYTSPSPRDGLLSRMPSSA